MKTKEKKKAIVVEEEEVVVVFTKYMYVHRNRGKKIKLHQI